MRDREEFSRLADIDVLGSIDGRRGFCEGTVRSRRSSSSATGASAAVAYRLLATTIESAQGDEPLRRLLIANTERGDGAGELAANLAAVAATGDARVTLVDLSDEGELGRLFGVTGALSKRGLTTRARPIRHGKDMIDRFRLAENRGVLLALPRDRGRQLDRAEAEALLAFLLKQSDRVILTAPPVDRSPNTLVWAQVADATVLVARPAARTATISDRRSSSPHDPGQPSSGRPAGPGSPVHSPVRQGPCRRHAREPSCRKQPQGRQGGRDWWYLLPSL